MTMKILLSMMLAFGLSLTASAGNIVANFDGGNSTLLPDAYTGMAGDGWAGSWQLPMWGTYPTTIGTVITSSDVGFNEMTAGGGNYLQIHHQGTTDIGIGRDFGGGDLDPAQPYTIEFSYRVDDGFDESFNSSNDRIQFFNSDEWRTGSDAGCSWIIGAYGGSTTWMNASDVGYWLFYDGKNDGSWSAAQQVNTGLVVTEGVTYDFSILVDPINLNYTPSVTDTSTGTTFTAALPLGWRTTETSMPTQFTIASRNDVTNDFLDYSVDNIVISQVPEPSTLIGLLTLLLVGFAIKRRR